MTNCTKQISNFILYRCHIRLVFIFNERVSMFSEKIKKNLCLCFIVTTFMCLFITWLVSPLLSFIDVLHLDEHKTLTTLDGRLSHRRSNLTSMKRKPNYTMPQRSMT